MTFFFHLSILRLITSPRAIFPLRKQPTYLNIEDARIEDFHQLISYLFLINWAEKELLFSVPENYDSFVFI